MEQTTKEVSEEKGRRVFLSVLGTSNYIPCVYCVDQVRLKETRFVQCASLQGQRVGQQRPCLHLSD